MKFTFERLATHSVVGRPHFECVCHSSYPLCRCFICPSDRRAKGCHENWRGVSHLMLSLALLLLVRRSVVPPAAAPVARNFVCNSSKGSHWATVSRGKGNRGPLWEVWENSFPSVDWNGCCCCWMWLPQQTVFLLGISQWIRDRLASHTRSLQESGELTSIQRFQLSAKGELHSALSSLSNLLVALKYSRR